MTDKLSQLEFKQSVLIRQMEVHVENVKTLSDLMKQEIEIMSKFTKRIEAFSRELLELHQEKEFINDEGF